MQPKGGGSHAAGDGDSLVPRKAVAGEKGAADEAGTCLEGNLAEVVAGDHIPGLERLVAMDEAECWPEGLAGRWGWTFLPLALSYRRPPHTNSKLDELSIALFREWGDIKSQ